MKAEDGRHEDFGRDSIGQSASQEDHRQRAGVRDDVLALPDVLSLVSEAVLLGSDPDVEIALNKVRCVTGGREADERNQKSVVLHASRVGLPEHGPEL